ncbi:uncharacterized protein LOC127157570 isoform X2 [Labeo rohita]|uniref:uncharacterized protein LOC127157570 isoform X2 n=1 Tax=Labeo rohita TaxID=84645 RepID=UPI0021E2C49E|nr:uncharacterized protein LOC127157570 isoform X2 [Labeo rohita]
MKIIWTFTLLMIPGVVSSINVTGYSGGGVIITCKYNKTFTATAKYFCRGQWSECTDQIRTEKKNKWVDSGRFSLYDDTRAAVFTVTIRDLSERDSGTYYCGVESLVWHLNIIKGQNISAVRGFSGGNVILNYKYKKQHKDHEKSARLLRVFITDLNVKDSKKYRIVVKVSEDYRFFSAFNLDIRDTDCCEKSISLSAAAGGSVNISCKYPQSHSADVKFVCRRSGSDLCAEETSVKENRRWSAEGQIQLYDDREQQLLTGTISHVTQQHSAEYWCGVQSDQGHKSFITRVLISVTETSSPPPSSSSSSSVSSPSSFRTSLITRVSYSSPSGFITAGSSLIIPLVLVPLVLIIGHLLFLFLCKKHQSQGSDSSSQAGAGKHDLVPHTGCVYEEIKNTHRQLPTNPSVSSDCVYATVHKVTGDPQILISSADDMNYAMVKKADCPDQEHF